MKQMINVTFENLGMSGKRRKPREAIAIQDDLQSDDLQDDSDEADIAPPVRGGSNAKAVKRPNVPHSHSGPTFPSSSFYSSCSSCSSSVRSAP